MCISACDVGCPAMLMSGVDDLEHMVTNYNETSLALWPYKYLATFKAEVERQQVDDCAMYYPHYLV